MRARSNLPAGWIAALVVLALGGILRADNLTARASVNTNSVYVGEPFRLTIQVAGSEEPEQPDLSNLAGFKATFAGGAQRSSQYTSIVNGQVTRVVHRGYQFDFDVRATGEGRLTIPPIEIRAEGKAARTQALTLQARKPSEVEEFKLRLSLSKARAYVGEQLMLEAVFFFRASVAEANLTLPIVENDAFEVIDLETDEQKKLEVLDGKQFNTLRVRKAVVPKRAGTFKLAPATLNFQGQDGTELVRDLFRGTVRRPKYRRFVIPSNELELEVEKLPTAGRPANFNGHVGEYALSVQASPTEVNVGDPITLNIAVSGPAVPDLVELPSLEKQENLARDFKIPAEREDGTVNGNFKVFSQTVRALREDVKEIPPIELVYFDTTRGSYEVARSEAIPLVVRATRVVTAGDAEGLGPVNAAQRELQSVLQGIAHNYTGAELLSRRVLGFQGLTSPGRLVLLGGPPLLYALLYGLVSTARRRNADPDSVRARRALAGFNREVSRAGSAEEVVAVFRRYLGDKLAMTSEALTFRDVESPLREHGVFEEQLADLKALFATGEASRFAGGSGAGEVEAVRAQAVKLVKELEKKLR